MGYVLRPIEHMAHMNELPRGNDVHTHGTYASQGLPRGMLFKPS